MFKVSEVSGQVSSESLNFGPKAIFGAVFSIILLGFFITLKQGCSYEVNHYKSKEVLSSKCFYDADLLEKGLVFLRCFLYVQISADFYTVYLIITLFTFIIQGFCYFIYMSYYNMWMNRLKIIESLEGVCFSTGFLVAQLMDNSTIIFLLTLAIQPFIFITAFSLVESRNEIIKNKMPGIYISSKVSFEHAVRNYLIQEEIIENFFKTSQKQLKETGDSFIYLFEAFYCQKVLKNSMLGLNKLSQFKPSIFKIFVGFHIFQAYKELTSTLEESTGLKLVLFLDSIENIIKNEMKYINSIRSLSINISQRLPSLKSLKSSITKISNNRLKVNKSYELCLKSYPNSSIALEMLGTFLVNILNDAELGKPILDRARFEDSSHVGKRNLLSSLTDNLMLLSVKPKEIGKILYLSRHLCKLLKIRFSESQDYYLKDFIPPPFNKKHDFYLKKFINCGETNVYSPGFTFFIKTRDDFMVEFEVQAEYLTINGKSFVISILKKSKFKREAALVSKNGDIFMNSRKFGSKVGLKNKNFEGNNIFSIIGQELSENSKSFIKVFDKKRKVFLQVGVSFQTKTVKLTNFYIIYLTKNFEPSSTKILSQKKNEPKKVKFEKSDIKNYSQYSERSNSEMTNCVKYSNVSNEQTHTKLIIFHKSKRIYTWIRLSLILVILMIFVLDVILMIYINQQVQHSSSLGSLNILGYYKYMSSYYSLISRITYMNDFLETTHFYENSEIYNIFHDLEQYKTELVDNYKDWSYCSISKEITENSNIIYHSNNTELKSIINEIIDFTSISKSFYEKVANGSTDYKSEVDYIHMNKFRLSLNKYEYFHDSFTNCEVVKVEKLKQTVYILFYLSMAILSFFLIFLSITIKLITKNLNIIWRIFYKRGKHGLGNVYENLTERIRHLYKRLPGANPVIPVFLNILKFDDFHHSYFYMCKFSFFIVLIVISHAIAVMFFYENLHYLLIKRIIFTNSDYDQRFNIINLSYFMTQSIAENDSSLKSIIPEINPFTNSLLETTNIKEDIIETRNKYFTTDLHNFYTKNAWKILYSSISDNNSYLKFGILQAYLFIIHEIEYLLSQPLNPKELQKFIENLKNLVKVLADTGVELESNTNEIINQQISSLMSFLVTSFIILLLLTIFYYLPFISSEKSLLDDLERFLQTIPRKKKITQKSS